MASLLTLSSSQNESLLIKLSHRVKMHVKTHKHVSIYRNGAFGKYYLVDNRFVPAWKYLSNTESGQLIFSFLNLRLRDSPNKRTVVHQIRIYYCRVLLHHPFRGGGVGRATALLGSAHVEIQLRPCPKWRLQLSATAGSPRHLASRTTLAIPLTTVVVIAVTANTDTAYYQYKH